MFCIIYDIMVLICNMNSLCESKYILNLYLPNFLYPRNGPTLHPICIYKVDLIWLSRSVVLLLSDQLHISHAHLTTWIHLQL